jgi:hypothetical protein
VLSGQECSTNHSLFFYLAIFFKCWYAAHDAKPLHRHCKQTEIHNTQSCAFFHLSFSRRSRTQSPRLIQEAGGPKQSTLPRCSRCSGDKVDPGEIVGVSTVLSISIGSQILTRDDVLTGLAQPLLPTGTSDSWTTRLRAKPPFVEVDPDTTVGVFVMRTCSPSGPQALYVTGFGGARRSTLAQSLPLVGIVVDVYAGSQLVI